MSAARRHPAITTILALGFSLAAASVSPSIRTQLSRSLGLNAPGGTWRAVAVLLALLNLKNLPMVWHYRLFRALIYHLYIQPTELPKEALFLPLITSTYTPLLEMDYNFHKSNSTYFTDLDIARTHLVTALLRKGIRGIGKYPENKGNVGWSIGNTSRAAGRRRGAKEEDSNGAEQREQEESRTTKARESVASLHINPFGTSAMDSGLNTPARSRTPEPTQTSFPANSLSPPASGPTASGPTSSPKPPLTEEQWWAEATKPGNLLIALGGNSCHYHREIPPYQRFEIWTRVLSWDRKWIYVVSHFVEAGAFKPKAYILQPWKKSKGGIVVKEDRATELSEADKNKIRRKIYASSISKYVVKKGRLTIPPELVLQRSEMLPPRPPNAPSTFFTGSNYGTPATSAPASRHSPTGGSPKSKGSPEGSDKTLDVLEESLFPSESNDVWTWEKVEAIRRKGLKLCQMFDGLDGLRYTFATGEEDGVMGRYSDLLV